MVKQMLQRVSKSVQFSIEVIRRLEEIGKSFGMTRYFKEDGEERGDVSKVVRRMVDYALADESRFREFLANPNAVKSEPKTKQEKEGKKRK